MINKLFHCRILKAPVHARLLDTSSSETLEALLKAEYADSSEVVLRDNENFGWEGYSQAKIIGVFSGRCLVSTMRGTIARDNTTAERMLSRPLPSSFASFPSLVLSNTATIKEFRNFGLSSVIRYYFLNSSIASEIQSAIGVLDANAQRIASMQKLGYRFTCPEPFDPGFVSRESTVAMLSRDHFPNAVAMLASRQERLISLIEWHGQPVGFA